MLIYNKPFGSKVVVGGCVVGVVVAAVVETVDLSAFVDAVDVVFRLSTSVDDDVTIEFDDVESDVAIVDFGCVGTITEKRGILYKVLLS